MIAVGLAGESVIAFSVPVLITLWTSKYAARPPSVLAKNTPPAPTTVLKWLQTVSYLVVQVLVIFSGHAGHQVVLQHVQLLVQRVHHLLHHLVVVEPACHSGRSNGQRRPIAASAPFVKL